MKLQNRKSVFGKIFSKNKIVFFGASFLRKKKNFKTRKFFFFIFWIDQYIILKISLCPLKFPKILKILIFFSLTHESLLFFLFI